MGRARGEFDVCQRREEESERARDSEREREGGTAEEKGRVCTVLNCTVLYSRKKRRR